MARTYYIFLMRLRAADLQASGWRQCSFPETNLTYAQWCVWNEQWQELLAIMKSIWTNRQHSLYIYISWAKVFELFWLHSTVHLIPQATEILCNSQETFNQHVSQWYVQRNRELFQAILFLWQCRSIMHLTNMFLPKLQPKPFTSVSKVSCIIFLLTWSSNVMLYKR